MTALAQDGNRTFVARAARGTYGIAANTRIFKGSILALDSAGRVIPATTLALGAVRGIGVASAAYDNRTGSELGGLADAVDVEVEYGVFSAANSAGSDAVTVAHVGQMCFLVDDDTVAINSLGTRAPAGIVTEVRGGMVYVEMQPDAAVPASPGTGIRVRNVLNSNVADLTAYTVASNGANNDAVLGVAGDLVLLIAQTTASQNGLYRIGVVTAGVAPLTRVAPFTTGAGFAAGTLSFQVAEGTVYGNTTWFNSAAFVVGTSDPACMPEAITVSAVLVAGTLTITSIPVLSATKTGFALTRVVANTSTLTTGGYALNGAPTPGVLGTATFAVFATVAAGTINVADISTLRVTVINR